MKWIYDSLHQSKHEVGGVNHEIDGANHVKQSSIYSLVKPNIVFFSLLLYYSLVGSKMSCWDGLPMELQTFGLILFVLKNVINDKAIPQSLVNCQQHFYSSYIRFQEALICFIASYTSKFNVFKDISMIKMSIICNY